MQLELITGQAMKAGFTGGMVVDYPNSTKAKKWVCPCLASTGHQRWVVCQRSVWKCNQHGHLFGADVAVCLICNVLSSPVPVGSSSACLLEFRGCCPRYSFPTSYQRAGTPSKLKLDVNGTEGWRPGEAVVGLGDRNFADFDVSLSRQGMGLHFTFTNHSVHRMMSPRWSIFFSLSNSRIPVIQQSGQHQCVAQWTEPLFL